MKYKVDLPSKSNSELAYFCGLITGDGSMPVSSTRRPNGRYQKRYLIHFYSSSLAFVENIYIPLFQKLFGLKPNVNPRRKPSGNILYEVRIESITIYQFLHKRIGVSIGKKAKIAKVPRLSKTNYVYFLAGLLDTDGGKKGNGFGLSTASQELANFAVELFNKLNLPYHSCPWHFNGHTYHQVYVHKRDFHKLLKYIPLKNNEKTEFLRANLPR